MSGIKNNRLSNKMNVGIAAESAVNKSNLQLDESWKFYLEEEFNKDYMLQLKEFLRTEYAKGKTIFPRGNEYFTAFNHTPFDKVKVVIVGQDPYHGPGQAHGLCFSVKPGVQAPPSLQNIFQELHDDLEIPVPNNGYLMSWADQGVLLLNAVLTVEASKAASHQNRGWEKFTDKVIAALNEHRTGLVFVLWGSYAQKKAAFVDRKKHFVIESSHPSPLSSYRGFFGSKPFSKINNYLVAHHQTPIDWKIPNI